MLVELSMTNITEAGAFFGNISSKSILLVCGKIEMQIEKNRILMSENFLNLGPQRKI